MTTATFARTAAVLLFLFSVVGSAASAGCAAPIASIPSEDVAESEDGLRASYGELSETLQGADLDAWIDVRRSLIAAFDRICGDTICSGDFSNLTTIRLACSSTRFSLKLKDCLWVLAGTIDHVDGATGAITTEARTFPCHVPVPLAVGNGGGGGSGNAKTLVSTLHAAGDRALETPLPGTGATFYDALVACFSGVAGSPPPPSSVKPLHLELAEHQWEHSVETGAAWFQTQNKLAAAFHDGCGDSFCEGDYPDIVALRLVCSVKASTNRVARCGWSFAGADVSVGPGGALAAHTFSKRCDFAVGTKVRSLTTALDVADPLNAPLPGRTASVHDALVGCL